MFCHDHLHICIFAHFHISTMNLEILTPERKLFSDDVYGVQLPGITGLFEVLDRHAPLVSALKAGRLKVLKDKNNHFVYFDIQSGFVEVLNNKVTVLVEGAVPAEGK
jgi:F-type H+-transporting ATPase subunit epsilon